MQVYRALVQEMKRQSVSRAFGLMGLDTARLIATMDSEGIRYISSRQDGAAVGMADGYARVSGEVGLAVVGRGPGLTNSLTSVVTAAKAGTPLVVLAGDTAAGLAGEKVVAAAELAPKYINQCGITQVAGIRSVSLSSPESAVADLAAVFECARSGATVSVNLPTDVLEAEAGDAPAQVTLPPTLPHRAPDPAQIFAVADLLTAGWASARPVILGGRGAVRAGARDALVRLGDRIGAVMANTLLARSLFAGTPFDVGLTGTFASDAATEFLVRADVLLAFGASLNSLQTLGGDLYSKATVVQFDYDPQAQGRHRPVDLFVEGDVALATTALVAELDRRDARNAGYRSDVNRAKIDGFDRAANLGDRSDAEGGDPRAVRVEFERVLPRERRIITDVGHHMPFTAQLLSVPDPGSWICFSDCSALGSGLGVALGAALADSERLTVLSVGDGGLMMALSELETAVHNKIPLVVLISNDSAYGAEVHALRLWGLDERTASFGDVSFAAVAAALGCRVATITSPEQIRDLAGQFDDLSGPFVIDCKVTTAVRSESVAMHHRLTDPRRGESHNEPAGRTAG